jgi:O-antigen ligase
VYVELLAQTGLLGLGTFLWLLCETFYQAISNASRLTGPDRILMLGMASFWVAFAVTGLGDVPFYHHEIRIVFFTFLALTYLRNSSLPEYAISN